MNKNKMKKRILLSLSLLILNLVPVNAFALPNKNEAETYKEWSTETFAEEGINVDAKSALLIEPISGKILFEKNPDEKFAPASVTKIMTILLTM